MKKIKRARGFTLIEMMVVGAIVAVMAALAVTGYAGIAERNAPQNAAYDLSAGFSKARARAAERNTNVWVMFWPRGGPVIPGTTGGSGAWAIYEDKDLNVDFTAINSPEDLSGPQLLEKHYLADYPKKNVKFGVPVTNSTAYKGLEIDATMTSGAASQTDTNTQTTFSTAGSTAGSTTTETQKANLIAYVEENAGCTFCDGTGGSGRGAIVFTPDGEARFYGSDGIPHYPEGGGKLMMVDNAGTNRAFLFSISQATSYVTFASN